MTEWYEVTVDCIHDRDAGLAAHEKRSDVVPYAVFIAVEIPVEAAIRDETEIECSRTVGAELPPARIPRGWAGNCNDALGEITRLSARNRFAVPPRTPSADRRIFRVRLGELGDDGDAWAFDVDTAERHCVPRDATTGVRAAVDRVDDDDEVVTKFRDVCCVESGGARLLAEDAPAEFTEGSYGGIVHDDVGGVLASLLTGERPVPSGGNGELSHVGDIAQRVQNRLVG